MMKTRILNRLTEPSTWVAVGSMLGVFGVDVARDWAGDMAGGAAAVASFAALIYAMMTRDKSHEK